MTPVFRRSTVGVIAAATVALLSLPLPAADFGAAGASQPAPAVMTRAEARARAEALTAVGRQVFFDPALSASGRMSCATCHDPDHGFAAPNKLAVQFGGPDLTVPGYRAVPSLKYLQSVPDFTEHYFESEDEGEESIDNGPTGGLTWDGRVDRGRDQAKVPLLSPFEMANPNSAALAVAAAAAPYAGELQRLFGEDLFANPDRTLAALTEALDVYRQAPEFAPYDSKYDAFLKGTVALSDQEARGLDLFNDEDKGNCAACHRSARGKNGTPPLFTDFGMIALGVPRNMDIPADADPAYFDLGLCGPLRTDFVGVADYCGLFRTPTLRNVALKGSFFHNGAFNDLRDVVAFYATRDTDPAKWYGRSADGGVVKFNDLPPEYFDNINTDAPFGGEAGGKPALTDAEIDDIVAFLKTLTDGYRPPR